jgi:UDP-N-acetyl-D-mannosaminuronate dehydrogenase
LEEQPLRHGKTLVVGIGEVGGALAEVLERSQPDVLRHDIERRDIKDAIGVMHICIPYQARQQFEPTTLEYIERFRPHLTVINSTVVPGTTRRIAELSGARLAYSPVRGKHARMTEDMLRYYKFVAAPNNEIADEAEAHFRSVGMKTRRIARLETLELAKLAETTYFGIQIAFAQELNRFSQKVQADYFEAIEFFDEIDFLPRVHYYPGFIGGHCVIPNIHLLKQVMHSPLLDAILESNDRRASELANEKNDVATDGRAEKRADRTKVVAHS